MAEIPFTNVEELSPAMAPPVPDDSRDCDSGAVQCFAGAHTELGHARHVSR